MQIISLESLTPSCSIFPLTSHATSSSVTWALVYHPWNSSLKSWHFPEGLAHHYVVSVPCSQLSSLLSLHWLVFLELDPDAGRLLYFVQLNSQMHVFQTNLTITHNAKLATSLQPPQDELCYCPSLYPAEKSPLLSSTECVLLILFNKPWITLVSIETWISWTFIFA